MKGVVHLELGCSLIVVYITIDWILSSSLHSVYLIDKKCSIWNGNTGRKPRTWKRACWDLTGGWYINRGHLLCWLNLEIFLAIWDNLYNISYVWDLIQYLVCFIHHVCQHSNYGNQVSCARTMMLYFACNNIHLFYQVVLALERYQDSSWF